MSKYFSESELACKCCGQLPAGGMGERLLQVLDAIREAVGSPVSLSCAYRCPEHNAEVGGVPNSYHIQGIAADVLVPDGMSVDELASIAEQCGAKGIGRYYSQEFVHVDTRGYEARWEE
ncbi:YcbK family protein [Sporomusa sp.]|uniref:YcbK family protein n=1 Tax=Sporomusa sp. TaxID=2078658 RepID=UPI002BC6380E|nr:D-Ala-D-Ala carboxypeptidase family metallohydrolase [Sporomusa sp.]HWR41832.1 D-Ala-D-Ala carboxypeptidase family metallohydrolase [Sporomusa sp.]